MTQRILAITGGQGALGSAVARVATTRNWRVALIDFAAAKPGGAGEKSYGGVNLTDAAAAKAVFAQVAADFGGLDALFNIAGGFAWQKVEDGDPATWAKMHALNVATCLNATRAALPLLRKSPAGRIVNVGANGALKAAAGMGAYAASKQGVHKLTESLAEELKDAGITVNAVLPSTIDTAANRADMPKADPKKWVAPEELAEVMLFLASGAASAVTGALIPVMGRV
ncbi:MAG TPA: SDR family NAD(P)-dependent oxidoreductase [Hyphomonadaceae bacterium]|nr:SDR family NAD(P)-dependent oxidoreductase [Hyphomonadaceae bacterium]